VKTGQIRVEAVSRRFRVRANEARSLKELFVLGGRTEATDVVALQDVSLAVEPGEAVGLVGRNGSGKSTLLRLIAGIIKPTEGSVAVGGRIGSLLELGAGFHPDFSGRENVFLNGAIYGLKRAQIRERFDEIVAFAELEQAIDRPVRTYSSGMYMRLGFAIAAHLDADVLLLDEVFAVGDEAFQRKCFGKIAEFKRRGGTIVFVSHDAQAVEMLCDRAVLLQHGQIAFDGGTREAIARYRELLSADASPDELSAGLREWGSGEARIVSARLLDTDGDERRQFASGEPFVTELRVVSEPGVPAPRVSLELRDDDGIALGGVTVATADLGWDARAGERELRFEVAQLPLAEGRFHLRCSLLDGDGGRLLHSLGDAVQFFVMPTGLETGSVLLSGRWSMQEIDASEPIGAPTMRTT
jgi:ABC-type polysaccharide/polyol phosphate transport system ATPase subunit